MNRAVKRGVRLLDKKGPEDWFLRVNVGTLDLSNATRCVVGQVYSAGYHHGLRELGIQRWEGYYGFLPGRGRERAWRQIILARQAVHRSQWVPFSLEVLYNRELSEEDRDAYSLID